MREVYSTLFEMNEYVYDLDNKKLKHLIVEVTGAEASSTPVRKTLATFTVLNKIANFEADVDEEIVEKSEVQETANVPNHIQAYTNHSAPPSQASEGINLSYTINLNLPPTTDIEVFNAIFKSLKQHLLQE